MSKNVSTVQPEHNPMKTGKHIYIDSSQTNLNLSYLKADKFKK